MGHREEWLRRRLQGPAPGVRKGSGAVQVIAWISSLSPNAGLPRWSSNLPGRWDMPDKARGAATVEIPRDRSGGGRLVASDGRTLPLREVTLGADASGGLARAVLHQRFVNPHTEPLRVSYLIPLPVDGALAGYAITIGGRRIVGEVDRVQAARERFESALLEGRSAGLVEQERPNLFTLELGNVPPGGEVLAELTIDQRLAWLDEGAWEWRFPTVVAPRYLGAEERVADAARIMVDVTEASVAAQATVTVLVRDALPDERAA